MSSSWEGLSHILLEYKKCLKAPTRVKLHLPKTHVNQVINQLSITFRGLTLCCLEGLSFSPLAQKAELQQVVCQSVMAYDGYVRLGFSNMKQRFTLYTLPLNMMLHVRYENLSFNSSKHPRRAFFEDGWLFGEVMSSCDLFEYISIIPWRYWRQKPWHVCSVDLVESSSNIVKPQRTK